MLSSEHRQALRIILARLDGRPIDWVVTGSAGMALQGVLLDVHDIDLQTDKDGAYEIERLMADYAVTPVRYLDSARIRSYVGKFSVNDVQVEVMGAIQKRLDDASWEDPGEVERYRRWAEMEGLWVPVLSLEYECQAYRKRGRIDKAELLWAWLQHHEGKQGTPGFEV